MGECGNPQMRLRRAFKNATSKRPSKHSNNAK